MKIHPVANIFPVMSDEEFMTLKSDIQDKGLLEPIWTHEGQITDGRHRYKACIELGIKPEYREWQGEGSLTDFVISLNLKRRHLNSSQKAAVVLNVLPCLEEEAKKRQGKRTDLADNITEKIPGSGEAREQAAMLLGTNAHYVSDAKRIKEASPEVFEQVLSGKMSIPEANQELFNIPHQAQGTGDYEWYTPSKIIEAVHQVLGEIDCDPASSKLANQTVKAKTYYTKETDGLKQKWGKQVFMNPPFSQPLVTQFCETLIEKLGDEVEEAIIVTNNATETKWGQLLLTNASAVCFPRGRLNFTNQDSSKREGGGALQGQVINYFGDNPQKFISVFSTLGVCFPAEKSLTKIQMVAEQLDDVA